VPIDLALARARPPGIRTSWWSSAQSSPTNNIAPPDQIRTRSAAWRRQPAI